MAKVMTLTILQEVITPHHSALINPNMLASGSVTSGAGRRCELMLCQAASISEASQAASSLCAYWWKCDRVSPSHRNH